MKKFKQDINMKKFKQMLEANGDPVSNVGREGKTALNPSGKEIKNSVVLSATGKGKTYAVKTGNDVEYVVDGTVKATFTKDELKLMSKL